MRGCGYLLTIYVSLGLLFAGAWLCVYLQVPRLLAFSIISIAAFLAVCALMTVSYNMNKKLEPVRPCSSRNSFLLVIFFLFGVIVSVLGFSNELNQALQHPLQRYARVGPLLNDAGYGYLLGFVLSMLVINLIRLKACLRSRDSVTAASDTPPPLP